MTTPAKMTEEQLVELERLYHAATLGKWRVRTLGTDCFVERPKLPGLPYGVEIMGDEDYDTKAGDAALIVAMHTHLPALLSAARANQQQADSSPANQLSMERQSAKIDSCPANRTGRGITVVYELTQDGRSWVVIQKPKGGTPKEVFRTCSHNPSMDPEEIAATVASHMRDAWMDSQAASTPAPGITREAVEGLPRFKVNEDGYLVSSLSGNLIERDRVLALASAPARDEVGRPPAGHIIDSEGVVRKVLGKLPLTADGCVIGHGAAIHCVVSGRGEPSVGLFQSSMTECDDWSSEPFDGSNWFDTHEAADAARRAAGGGGGAT